MTARLAVLLAFLLAGFAAQAEVVRIGTWNVRNFLVSNRFEEGQFLFQYPMPESRKARLRATILLHRPDILFLQEMGSRAFLLELQLDLRAEGLDYPYAVFSARPGARSGLACLARVPPMGSIFHEPRSSGHPLLRRGIQELSFQLHDQQVRCFHVHLKSRYSDDPADPESIRLRRKEILALAAFLQQHPPNSPSQVQLLLGDFNTPFQDPLLKPIRQYWSPLPARSPNGSPDTYFHHSGQTESLDGFWIPKTTLAPVISATIPDGAFPSASDHRLVLAFLNFSLPPPP